MVEAISNLIIAAVSLLGAIVAALIAGLMIWTFRDIRQRSRDPLVQILATVMVGVIPIAGILIYLLLRPRETLSEQYIRALEEEALLASIEQQEFCPTCGRRVDADMQFCPTCHTRLRKACPSCGRAVHLAWDLCPYCGQALVPELPNVSVGKPERPAIASAVSSARDWLTSRVRAQQKLSSAEVSSAALPGATSTNESRPAQAEAETPPTPLAERLSNVLGRSNRQKADPQPPASPSNAATPPNGTPRPARKPLISREELE